MERKTDTEKDVTKDKEKNPEIRARRGTKRTQTEFSGRRVTRLN